MFPCHTNDPAKIIMMSSLLILGGVLPLTGAILSQYVLHLPPCHFCLLQRYPYVFLIAMGALSLLVRRGGLPWRVCVALGIMGLLTTATLGLIHTGIESHVLHYAGGCVSQTPADGSLEALRMAIANAPVVACDAVMAQFLGLSMATWNVLWASLVILAIALQYPFDRRRYDAQHA